MKFRTLFSMAASVALAVIFSSGAQAYRLMNVPTANVLSPGDLRLEAQSQDLEPGSASYYRVDFGMQGLFDRALELQLSYQDDNMAGDNLVLGLEKQIVPESGLLPALAVGVLDVGNTTETGRSPYAVAGMLIPLTDVLPLPIRDIHVHAGVGGGFYKGFFAGASMKLPLGFGVEVENDSHGFNYAGTWSPIKLIKLRAMSINGDPAYSLIVTPVLF